jgi:hypothetical protein
MSEMMISNFKERGIHMIRLQELDSAEMSQVNGGDGSDGGVTVTTTADVCVGVCVKGTVTVTTSGPADGGR